MHNKQITSWHSRKKLASWYSSLNPQHRLIKMIEDDDFKGFCYELKMGNDPSKVFSIENRSISAYEFALTTYGRSEFVKKCLEWGCSPYYIDPKTKKPAIHYAADSKDPNIFKILLEYPGIDVHRKHEGETTLNFLIDSYKSELGEADIADKLQCIKRLLEYGASPNLCDINGISPIMQALNLKHLVCSDFDRTKRIKSELITLLLTRGDPILDEEALEEIRNNYADIKVPLREPHHQQSVSIDDLEENIYDVPPFSTGIEEENRILKAIQGYLLHSFEKDPVDKLVGKVSSLIDSSILNKQNLVFNALLQIDYRVHDSIETLEMKHAVTALDNDNCYALEQLFLYKNIESEDKSELLMRSLRNYVERWENLEDREKCFEAILEHTEKTDVNYFDKKGHSLLSYADKLKPEEIGTKPTRKLLEKGAYIGTKNRLQEGKRALQNLSSELLEQHLDTCVTTNELNSDDKNFEISMDYKNLTLTSLKPQSIVETTNCSCWGKKSSQGLCSAEDNLGKGMPIRKSSQLELFSTPGQERPSTSAGRSKRRSIGSNSQNKTLHSNISIALDNLVNQTDQQACNAKLRQEIDSITFFTESPKYKRLILHPLLRSFILLKWHRISPLFYINFTFYVSFWLSMLCYTFFIFGAKDHVIATSVFWCLSLIGCVLLLVREVFQLCLTGCDYCLSFVNWMEILMILFSFLTLSFEYTIIAVITLLLMSWELSLLLASFPNLNISTLVLMFKTVLVTFSKCFLVFAVFLINFSVVFFISSMKRESLTTDSIKNAASDKESTTSELNENATMSNENSTSNISEEKFKQIEEFDFNKFTNPLTAFLKTLVMLTGEFDASSFPLNDFLFCLVFLLFIILITIVLSNLLYGLAVSDTQAIQAEAELSGLLNRVKLLQSYVKILDSQVFQNRCCRKILEFLLDFNKIYSTCDRIAILPNQNNRVQIESRNNQQNSSKLKIAANKKRTFFHILTPCCFTSPIENPIRGTEMEDLEASPNQKSANDSTENEPTLDAEENFLPEGPVQSVPDNHDVTKKCALFHSLRLCCCSVCLDTETTRLAFSVIERKSIDKTEKMRAQEAKEQQENFERNLEKKLALIQSELKSHVDKLDQRFKLSENWQINTENRLSAIEENLLLVKSEMNANTKILNQILSHCKTLEGDKSQKIN